MLVTETAVDGSVLVTETAVDGSVLVAEMAAGGMMVCVIVVDKSLVSSGGAVDFVDSVGSVVLFGCTAFSELIIGMDSGWPQLLSARRRIILSILLELNCLSITCFEPYDSCRWLHVWEI